MASLASYRDSKGKVSFSRRPPPPFDTDFVRYERQSDDTDEDWLPDVKDVVSGNYSVLIDLTGDSDCEGVAGFPARDLQFDSEMGNLAKPSPTTLEPFSFDTRPPRACQPSKAVDSLDLGQVEIPESPGAVQASPTASVRSSRHSDKDSSAAAGAATATAAITQAVTRSTRDG
ncbi:hypothetical protein MMC13_007616 [Lambiella insularis]|nr:hypothetical protein [Lambiella insularis]